MKCLYFLVFLGMAQGYVVEHKEKRDLQLQAPVIGGLVAKDDSLTVHWSKVVSPDHGDPVLGYIVKVWVIRDSDHTKMDPNVIPTETPREIKVDGADNTTVDVKNIKHKVQYHIRVLAYTKNQRGPLSGGAGVKLLE